MRWVATEYLPEYIAAFNLDADERGWTRMLAIHPEQKSAQIRANPRPDEARRFILERFLRQAGPVTSTAILARYAFPPEWLAQELAHLVESRNLAHGQFSPATTATTTAHPRIP